MHRPEVGGHVSLPTLPEVPVYRCEAKHQPLVKSANHSVTPMPGKTVNHSAAPVDVTIIGIHFFYFKFLVHHLMIYIYNFYRLNT